MQKQILILLIAVLSGINYVAAQCTPKAQYADSSSGVWPSIIENLPCAFADNPAGYSTSIDIKTISDTIINYMGFSIQALIRAIRISDLTGLPDGFNYAPDQAIWENGGSSPNFTPVQGCIHIGAPIQPIQQLSLTNPNGIDFNLKVFVDLQIDSVIPDNPLLKPLYGRWLSEINTDPLKPVEVNGYQIRIRSSAGPCVPLDPTSIQETENFKAARVYPNPANDLTNITYNSISGGSARLDIYNATGALVESRMIRSNPGENRIELQTGAYAGGLYHFTLSNQSDLLHGSFIRSQE